MSRLWYTDSCVVRSGGSVRRRYGDRWFDNWNREWMLKIHTCGTIRHKKKKTYGLAFSVCDRYDCLWRSRWWPCPTSGIPSDWQLRRTSWWHSACPRSGNPSNPSRSSQPISSSVRQLKQFLSMKIIIDNEWVDQSIEKGECLSSLKRALAGQKWPRSYELYHTLTHVRYHLHKKRKNTGIFIFQALQNGVKHI